MRRLVLLIAAQLLVFGAGGPSHAAGDDVAAQTLPRLDAQGRVLPLTVDQLTPEEAAKFASLPAGGVLATRFLYTRGFLRLCRKVADGALPPLELPERPSDEHWDRRFLSVEEGRDVVDVALGMQLMALLGIGAK